MFILDGSERWKMFWYAWVALQPDSTRTEQHEHSCDGDKGQRSAGWSASHKPTAAALSRRKQTAKWKTGTK